MLTEKHKCLIENKILGLRLDKFEDKSISDFNEIRERFDVIPTKRNVTEVIASIYDPLGLLNPIVVQMKTFFQKLCSAKYDWDDLITNVYLEEWNELVKSLSAIQFNSVPRLYCYHNTNDPVVTIELHRFCDGSMKAYRCSKFQICQSGISYFQAADCTLAQAKYLEIIVLILLVISSSN